MNIFKNEMNVKLEPKLEKCPICQGMAEIKKSFAVSSHDVLIDSMWVQCLSCGLRTEKNYYAYGSSAEHCMEEVAIKTWNERKKEDITEEQAIDKLHETGWLQKHDEDLGKAELAMSHPEIVHCKDCKHRPKKVEDSGWLEFPDDACITQCDDPWYEWIPEDDFYCAYGERRSEDEDKS